MGEESREEFNAGAGAGAGMGRKQVDMTIFGFKFQDLSTELKYFISFLLIGLIFGGMYYGLVKVKSFDRKIKNKVKKDKKK